MTKQEILERVRATAPYFVQNADAAEKKRRIPEGSADKMLELGLARLLIPHQFGGSGLASDTAFETWYEVILEISKADASHGWCAALMSHHAQMIAQFPEELQR